MIISHDTNYSQKTLKNLIDYFDVYKKIANAAIKEIASGLSKEIKVYIQQSHQDFGIVLENSYETLNTAKEEISLVLGEMKSGIKENHPERMSVLGKEFSNLNRELGKVWHANFINHDYRNINFIRLEHIYAKTRDAVIALSELGDASDRLKNFVGSATRDKITPIKNFTFDNDTASLKINDDNEISLPPYTNQYYLCKAMFKRQVGEAVDWSIIYQEITGSDPTGKEADAKMVLDACNQTNKRIRSVTGKETKLFLWRKKTLTRLY